MLLLREVGTSNATVYLVLWEGRLAIAKEHLHVNQEAMPVHCRNELQILRHLNGCQYTPSFIDVNSSQVITYLICEYIPVALDSLCFNIFDATFMVHYSKMLLQGVLALLDRGVLHGDIKTSNLRVRSNGELVFIDYDSAIFVDLGCRSHLGKTLCTLNTRAPEAMNENEHDLVSADLWACGCVIATMHTGAPLIILSDTTATETNASKQFQLIQSAWQNGNQEGLPTVRKIKRRAAPRLQKLMTDLLFGKAGDRMQVALTFLEES